MGRDWREPRAEGQPVQKLHAPRGLNAVSALVLPQVSARTVSTMEVMKWEAALANVLIAHNLSQVVEDGKPPTQEAVLELFSNETKEQSKERYYAAMREYQDYNTRLYFLVTPSFNLQGPWEQNDIETIQRDYAPVKSLLRDGRCKRCASFCSGVAGDPIHPVCHPRLLVVCMQLLLQPSSWKVGGRSSSRFLALSRRRRCCPRVFPRTCWSR